MTTRFFVAGSILATLLCLFTLSAYRLVRWIKTSAPIRIWQGAQVAVLALVSAGLFHLFRPVAAVCAVIPIAACVAAGISRGRLPKGVIDYDNSK
jgi:uncharacterized membrane protein YraQ (UPF0718 family)